jgi:hypothetical protein
MAPTPIAEFWATHIVPARVKQVRRYWMEIQATLTELHEEAVKAGPRFTDEERALRVAVELHAAVEPNPEESKP